MQKLKHNFLFFSISLYSVFAFSQSFADNWKAHFAYLNFVDIAVAEERIYVAADNSIFVHNTQTNTNKEYTTVERLSGGAISALHYSDANKLIVIGYENGLLDIVDEISGKVTTLVDIKDQLGIPPNSIKINEITENENLLYIATGFGIVEFNLNKRIFEDTYFISNSSAIVSDVKTVHVFGDFVFASIVGRGTFRGNKKDFNLIQFENWAEIQPEVFSQIETFAGQVVAHSSTRILYKYNGTSFVSAYTNSENIKSIKGNESILSVTGVNNFVSLKSDLSLDQIIQYGAESGLNNKVTTSVFIKDEIYFSNNENGFYRTNNKNFNGAQIISPAGPASNNAFALDAFDGDLWMVYGSANLSFVPTQNKIGPTRFKDNRWFTYENSKFNNATVLSDVKINRKDKKQVFIGSFRFKGGLFEINDAEEIVLYNEKNSNIQLSELRPGFISVFSFEFDSNGELWIINNELPQALKRFKKDINAIDSDNSVNISGLIAKPQFLDNINANEIIIDEDDNIYLTSTSDGVLGYQPKSKRIASLSPEKLNFPFVKTRALALDFNNDLWVGTTSGLRVISDPERMFQNNSNVEGESIIILEEGVPQELLFQQSVTDIKVDASNNKWVSTAGAGIFYFSSDGQETLLNFTSTNSPLPSNNINDMALDESLGIIYFATDKGLVSYKTTITAPEETLEKLKIFPNPVRPEYGEVDVKIQGLTSGANVKITDIEGNLVFEVQNPTFNGESSGSVSWDTRSFTGKKVATGVYLVLITGKEGEENTIGKILIVR